MGKLLRILGGLIGLVVVLLIALVIAVPMFFDPNDHKDRIVALVEENTGRKLSIEGDLKLSVLPWLAVDIGTTRLSNASGFEPEYFASVSDIEVRVKLMPLLRKEVEMSTVILNGLELNLAKAADGRTNWDDLVAAGDDAPEAEKSSGDAALPIAALAIGGVQVRDARVVWDDQAVGSKYDLKDINLTLGAVRLGEPVEFALDFGLDADQPAMSGQFDLRGVASAADEFKRITVDGMKLNIDAKGDTLPGGRLIADLSADVALDKAQDVLTLNGLVVNLSTEGKGLPADSVTAKLTSGMSFALERQLLELSDIKLNVNAKGGELPGGAINADLASSAVLDLQKQTLSLPEILLTAMDLTLRGKVDGTGVGGEAPAFAGTLALDEFVPRSLLQKLKVELPEMSDATVLGKASLNTGFKATTNSAELTGLKLRLDDSALTGTAGINNFQTQAMRFNLNLDAIDLDRYLPPQTEGDTKVAATPAEAAAAGAGMLPVETLRALNLDGTLKIGTLRAFQLRSKDVVVTVKGKDSVVRVYPASAKLYGGTYAGDITLDVTGKQPTIRLDENVKNVNIAGLLKDMTGEAKLTGRANVSAKLSARGNTPQAIQRTLNGEAAFKFRNGAIKGVDIQKLISSAKSAQAALKGQAPAADAGGTEKKTDFTEIAGTATVKQGIVTNKDLSAKSPFLRVAGEGTVDLPQQGIDYLLTTKIVKTAQGQGGAGLADLKGIAIPVRISGTFAQPKFRVDLEKALGEAAKAKVKEEVEKQKEAIKQKAEEKLQDQLKDKLPGGLGDLLGR